MVRPPEWVRDQINVWAVEGAAGADDDEHASPEACVAAFLDALAEGETADATAMLTGGPDTIVRLWDITPLSLDELAEWTRTNRYVPELTCRQRDQYRIQPPCGENGNVPEVMTAD